MGEDIVKVIVEAHREELLVEHTRVMNNHVELDQELFALVGDINNNVASVINDRIQPDVSNGICRIHTAYVPNPIINWLVGSVTYRTVITIGDSPSVDYYDQLKLKHAHIIRHADYITKRAKLMNDLDSVVYQLEFIHEKEVQLKGEITLGLLVELGLDYLLDNNKIQGVMGMLGSNDRWINQQTG